MKTITHAEWLAEGERLFGPDPKKWVFVCPSCKTPQTAQDFLDRGWNRPKGELNNYLGFSCIGRFYSRIGCDWSLGGLLQIHTLEVEFEDGKKRPVFEFGGPRQEELPAVAIPVERDAA